MFTGPRRRYFEVVRIEGGSRAGTGHLDGAIERLLDKGKKLDREEINDAARTGDEQLPTHSTPWMRKTQWTRKFGGRDLLAVAAVCRKPDKDEGSLLLVWQSVHRILERCRASVIAWHDHEEDGDVVLGWLSSPQTDKYNPERSRCFPNPMSRVAGSWRTSCSLSASLTSFHFAGNSTREYAGFPSAPALPDS
ncbi:hypothetical protein LTR09_012563 [Extremus antarcticus]|uniref:Uncharacterized protein n=1 Tax=Extremus antarcticus TaxID=702011 RepID=A0AAJ0D4S4_9PEZI|nr:hypothetical protein LTR09_012563 [Extremus antarcticus]